MLLLLIHMVHAVLVYTGFSHNRAYLCSYSSRGQPPVSIQTIEADSEVQQNHHYITASDAESQQRNIRSNHSL
ncbi:hypothetical protein F5Y06DRAFT_276609, partial [Hypoxylon sp. FL0890]